MFGGGFKSSKLKAQLQLSGSRIKVIRTKKQNQLVHKRKDLANLLSTGQEPRARIRVEDLMREENTVDAYDILELYCELLVTRMPIIESQKACPADLKDAVASIIFAAPRSADLPELMQARNMFVAKYGKEFVMAAEELRPECGVNRMIINKLSVRTPSPKEKLEKLKTVAQEQNVDWDGSLYAKEILDMHDPLFDNPGPYPGEMGQPPAMATPQQQGGLLAPLAAATAAAVTAHALGKHLDGDSGAPGIPAPPPPFQADTASAPGQPTEAFLSPNDYNQRWAGAPAAAAGGMGSPPGGSMPSVAGPGDGADGRFGAPPQNPLDYPALPAYRDGKVLPKDPMDYAPPAYQGQSVSPSGDEFPSVPKSFAPPPSGYGGGGGMGAAAAAAPQYDGRIGPKDEFSHTSVFERKRAEREQQMRAIQEAGERAKAAAVRAAEAAGMADAPAPRGSAGGVHEGGGGGGGYSSFGGPPKVEGYVAKAAFPGAASTGLGGGAGGGGGGTGGGGGGGAVVEPARAGGEEDVSSEFPTPPQGFAGASAFDDILAGVRGGSSRRGGGGGGVGVSEEGEGEGSGESESDISLPSPPVGWGGTHGSHPARPDTVLPPPSNPHAGGVESEPGALLGLEDLRKKFNEMRQRTSDRSQMSGY